MHPARRSVSSESRSAPSRARDARQYAGAQFAGADRPSGEIRDQTACGCAVLNTRGGALERVEHRLHQRRVERVRDREPPALDAVQPRTAPAPSRRASSRPEMTTLSGPLTAAIDKRAGMRRDRRATRVPRRRTPPPSRRTRQRLHQPAACGDKRKPSSRLNTPATQAATISPDAVAQHDRRLDTPRAPQLASAYSSANSAGCV